jgi:hypothetical protein
VIGLLAASRAPVLTGRRMKQSRGTATNVAESASAAAANDSFRDRRRAIRVRHKTTFVIRQLLSNGVGEPMTVVLLDMSETGVGVMHSIPLRCGDQFQIPLTSGAASAETMTLICTVVRCEMLDDGLYNIGMEFNSPARAVDEGRRQLTGKKR